jgi:selenocysteine-specific elongation factor
MKPLSTSHDAVTTKDGSFIIGTAGHIDHGKTSLVHALTGIDTDRLPVEKARGITTELGFAHMQLAIGEGRALRQVAMIDVPGHEKFVHAMVTGVGGIDVVCFVISAEEGIKPQTREHMDICRMLCVQQCVVALTKIDAVSSQRLGEATVEVAAFLQSTPYAACAVVPVSARSGQGIDDLKRALGVAMANVAPRRSGRLFRLPIDRIFSLKGVGTVVTGTVMGGTVQVDDQLAVSVQNQVVRVRGLQVHGKSVRHAEAGMRVALNVVGIHGAVGVEDFARGNMLSHVGACTAAHIVDVQVSYVAAAKKSLASESQVIIHHGAAQVAAKMRLLHDAELAPGASGSAQLRFDERHALLMLPGDRFVIRGSRDIANHGRTLGGGVVVRPGATKYRKQRKHLFDSHAAELDRAAVMMELVYAGVRGVERKTLSARCGIDEVTTAAVIEQLVGESGMLVLGDKWLLSRTAINQLREHVIASLTGSPPLRRESLRQTVAKAGSKSNADVFLLALQLFAQQGLIALDQDMVSIPLVRQSATRAAPALSAVATNLLKALRAADIATPKPSELAAALRMSESAVIQQLHDLIKAGLVCKIKPDYFISSDAFASLQTKLLAHFGKQSSLSPTQWKELTAVSRKYSIPLIEYFDAQKITLRVGDDRKLRQKGAL